MAPVGGGQQVGGFLLAGVPLETGKVNVESGAAAGRGGDGDFAAALLDNAIDVGKAQAGAFAGVLGGEKRLEQVGLHFGRHAAAGVRDAQKSVGAGRQMARGKGARLGQREIAGFDAQDTPLRHGVAGVDGQVEDQLLHLAEVGPNADRRLGQGQFQLNVFAQNPPQQVRHLRHRAVQDEQSGFEHLLAAKGQQLPCQ